MNQRPKQPSLSGGLGNITNSEDDGSVDEISEPMDISFNKDSEDCESSYENYDVDASPNIGSRQLQKLQSIKTLSNQLILRGSRFEEKRLLEARQYLIESRSQDGISEHTFNRLQLQSKQASGPRAHHAVPTKHSRKYNIDQNPQLTELKMPKINLKFVSLNLFSKNLQNIDLSENQIKTLPEEIATISTLSVLKIDQN